MFQYFLSLFRLVTKQTYVVFHCEIRLDPKPVAQAGTPPLAGRWNYFTGIKLKCNSLGSCACHMPKIFLLGVFEVRRLL